MTVAFCRIARSIRMRCVANKVCAPCCAQPDSSENVDDSFGSARGDSCFIAAINLPPIAALQHQLNYTSNKDLCQDVPDSLCRATCNRNHETVDDPDQEIRKPPSL